MVPVYTHEQFKNYWLQGRIDLGELLGKKLKPVVKSSRNRGRSMTRKELLVRQEQCRRRMHGFQFYADNQNLSSADRYFAVVMVEQEQDNIDDLRLFLEKFTA